MIKDIMQGVVWLAFFAVIAFGIHQCTVLRMAGMQ